MSYSFGIKAENKQEAKAAVMAKFDEMVVATQPIHERDRGAVLANAAMVIDLLADDDTKDITVSCNGYVSWHRYDEDGAAAFSSAAISCSAGHANRE